MAWRLLRMAVVVMQQVFITTRSTGPLELVLPPAGSRPDRSSAEAIAELSYWLTLQPIVVMEYPGLAVTYLPSPMTLVTPGERTLPPGRQTRIILSGVCCVMLGGQAVFSPNAGE